MLRIMTDHEMALKLGNRIVQLQRDVSALQAVLGQYILVTPGNRREIPQEPKANRIATEQERNLAVAIGEGKDASELMHALYREFLEEA
jgi:hypothetical protein